MQDVGGEKNRRKNAFDPLNHPVRIFRRDPREAKRLSIEGYRKRVDTYHMGVREKNKLMAQEWQISAKEHSSASRIQSMMGKSQTSVSIVNGQLVG